MGWGEVFLQRRSTRPGSIIKAVAAFGTHRPIFVWDIKGVNRSDQAKDKNTHRAESLHPVATGLYHVKLKRGDCLCKTSTCIRKPACQLKIFLLPWEEQSEASCFLLVAPFLGI